MIRRIALAVLCTMTAGFAADAPGLEDPDKKNPTAQRLRDKAQQHWQAANAVFVRARSPKEGETEPTAEELRAALDQLVDAIEIFEDAQKKQWDTATNAVQAQAVRTWAEVKESVPALPPPTEAEALAKWKKAEAKAASRRKRDARRLLGKVLAMRRYSQLFQRCPRCDGRGEFTDRFGGQRGEKPKKRTCKTCDGQKLVANRKRILASHWFCYSPNFRSDGRNRSDMNYVLRLGVRGERKFAPYIMSTRIGSKLEDHGWWLRATVVEKVHEDPRSRKGTERTTDYVIMKIGKLWWIHSDRFDGRSLLKVPEKPE